MSERELSRLSPDELRAYRAGLRDGRRDESGLGWGLLALVYLLIAALALVRGGVI